MSKLLVTGTALGFSVALGLCWVGRASAETLVLDCRSSIPNLVFHIWVSSEPKSVTVQPVVNGRPETPVTETGSGIKIDSAQVFWRDRSGSANANGETIDRNAGTWVSNKYAGSDGLTQQAVPRTYSCEKSTAVMPPAKF